MDKKRVRLKLLLKETPIANIPLAPLQSILTPPKLGASLIPRNVSLSPTKELGIQIAHALKDAPKIVYSTPESNLVNDLDPYKQLDYMLLDAHERQHGFEAGDAETISGNVFKQYLHIFCADNSLHNLTQLLNVTTSSCISIDDKDLLAAVEATKPLLQGEPAIAVQAIKLVQVLFSVPSLQRQDIIAPFLVAFCKVLDASTHSNAFLASLDYSLELWTSLLDQDVQLDDAQYLQLVRSSVNLLCAPDACGVLKDDKVASRQQRIKRKLVTFILGCAKSKQSLSKDILSTILYYLSKKGPSCQRLYPISTIGSIYPVSALLLDLVHSQHIQKSAWDEALSFKSKKVLDAALREARKQSQTLCEMISSYFIDVCAKQGRQSDGYKLALSITEDFALCLKSFQWPAAEQVVASLINRLWNQAEPYIRKKVFPSHVFDFLSPIIDSLQGIQKTQGSNPCFAQATASLNGLLLFISALSTPQKTNYLITRQMFQVSKDKQAIQRPPDELLAVFAKHYKMQSQVHDPNRRLTGSLAAASKAYAQIIGYWGLLTLYQKILEFLLVITQFDDIDDKTQTSVLRLLATAVKNQPELFSRFSDTLGRKLKTGSPKMCEWVLQIYSIALPDLPNAHDVLGTLMCRVGEPRNAAYKRRCIKVLHALFLSASTCSSRTQIFSYLLQLGNDAIPTVKSAAISSLEELLFSNDINEDSPLLPVLYHFSNPANNARRLLYQIMRKWLLVQKPDPHKKQVLDGLLAFLLEDVPDPNHLNLAELILSADGRYIRPIEFGKLCSTVTSAATKANRPVMMIYLRMILACLQARPKILIARDTLAKCFQNLMSGLVTYSEAQLELVAPILHELATRGDHTQCRKRLAMMSQASSCARLWLEGKDLGALNAKQKVQAGQCLLIVSASLRYWKLETAEGTFELLFRILQGSDLEHTFGSILRIALQDPGFYHFSGVAEFLENKINREDSETTDFIASMLQLLQREEQEAEIATFYTSGRVTMNAKDLHESSRSSEGHTAGILQKYVKLIMRRAVYSEDRYSEMAAHLLTEAITGGHMGFAEPLNCVVALSLSSNPKIQNCGLQCLSYLIDTWGEQVLYGLCDGIKIGLKVRKALRESTAEFNDVLAPLWLLLKEAQLDLSPLIRRLSRELRNQDIFFASALLSSCARLRLSIGQVSKLTGELDSICQSLVSRKQDMAKLIYMAVCRLYLVQKYNIEGCASELGIDERVDLPSEFVDNASAGVLEAVLDLSDDVSQKELSEAIKSAVSRKRIRGRHEEGDS